MHARIRFVSLIVSLACVVGSTTLAAQAQAPATLDTLQIALWPEFDQAGVLVLIDGGVGADTTLPATLTLTLPVEPSAVAEQATDGSLLNATFTTAAGNGGVVVTMTLQQPRFRVEYYDPNLKLDGDTRTFNYAWQAPTAVGAAVLRVQQPAGAGELGLPEGFGAATVGEFGLSYYQKSLGALTAGAPISVAVTYTKSGTALTSEQINVNPAPAATAAPVAAPVATTAPDNNLWLAGLVGAVGVVLAVIAGVLYLRGRDPGSARRAARTGGPARRHRRPQPAPNATPVASATTAPRRFCTQCGQPVSEDDRFCRQCGAPVKA